MKKVLIINGPNLNLLGKRESHIYGEQDFESYFDQLKSSFPEIELSYYQSNVEGYLINKLHEVGFSVDGIIINAGGYSHTSVALRDAIKAIPSPVVEVHISNIYARERFRHHSMLSAVSSGVICGLGLQGYDAALNYFQNDSNCKSKA